MFESYQVVYRVTFKTVFPIYVAWKLAALGVKGWFVCRPCMSLLLSACWLQ